MKKVVIAVISYNGMVLIGRKRGGPLKFLVGKWYVPGKTVEEGESDEEALIRCARKETGLKIQVGKYLGSYKIPPSKMETRWYECFASTDEAVPRNNIDDILWVPRNQVISTCGPRTSRFWPDEIKDYLK